MCLRFRMIVVRLNAKGEESGTRLVYIEFVCCDSVSQSHKTRTSHIHTCFFMCCSYACVCVKENISTNTNRILIPQAEIRMEIKKKGNLSGNPLFNSRQRHHHQHHSAPFTPTKTPFKIFMHTKLCVQPTCPHHISMIMRMDDIFAFYCSLLYDFHNGIANAQINIPILCASLHLVFTIIPIPAHTHTHIFTVGGCTYSRHVQIVVHLREHSSSVYHWSLSMCASPQLRSQTYIYVPQPISRSLMRCKNVKKKRS